MYITRYDCHDVDYDVWEWSSGPLVKYADHLAVIEDLEYDIRYEREQKEQVQEEMEQLRHEMEYYKKLCEDNFDISGIEF